MTVIDANGLILGRLASMVAKKLLTEKDRIYIVNAEKAVVSGSQGTTFAQFRTEREIGSPEFGPYYPKRPDNIVRRVIRGMLPYKRARGRDAMARLKVYVGVPAEFKDAEMISVEEADMHRLSSSKYVELGEVSLKLGAKF